jgi:hypothetical protein
MTRCIILRDGEPGDSCWSRDLSCFLLPRARSDRRPITHHAAKTDGSGRSTNQSSSGGRASQSQTQNLDLQNNQFDWNWTLPTKCLDGRSQSTALLNLDRSLLSPPTTASLGLHPPVAELDVSHIPKADGQHLRLTERSTTLAIETPDPKRSLFSDPSWDHEIRMERRLGEKEFSISIQLCTKV